MARVLFVFMVLALAAVVLADDQYITKYDNVNVDEILGNERLTDVYKKCLLGENDSACPEEGKALRSLIPDALSTNCEKCSEKQKDGSKKVIKWIIDNDAEGWKKLKSKWDPTGEFTKKFE